MLHDRRRIAAPDLAGLALAVTMVFLGYRAKRPWRPDPAWDPEGKTGVLEVCSASDCLGTAAGWKRRRDCDGAACCADAIAVPALTPPSGGDGPSDFEALGFEVLARAVRVNQHRLVDDREAPRLVARST